MYNLRNVYTAFEAVGQHTVSLDTQNPHAITVSEIEAACTDVSVEQVLTALNDITNAEPMSELRAKRDALLNQCDWVVSKAMEAGQVVPIPWQTYRQALRDITNTYTSLDDVVWPTKP